MIDSDRRHQKDYEIRNSIEDYVRKHYGIYAETSSRDVYIDNPCSGRALKDLGECGGSVEAYEKNHEGEYCHLEAAAFPR